MDEMAPDVDAPPAAPLTFGQEQLLVIERIAPPGTLTFPLRLTPPNAPRASAVTETLSWIVRRHDALRMSVVDNGGARQVASTSRPVLLVPDGADPLAYGAAAPANRAGTVPLYFSLDERLDPPQVVIYLHHLFTDGWSSWLVAKEFIAAYPAAARGDRLSARRGADSFAVYARRLRAAVSDEEIKAHMSFWARELEGAVPLELPYADATWRPGSRFGHFPGLSFEVATCSLNQVHRASARARASSSALVLAAFAEVLSRATGQRDLILQAAIADRGSHGKRSLVGFLLNRCVLRVEVASAGSAPDATIPAARRALTKALRYQVGPFLTDARRTDAGRVLNLSPRVTIAFNHDIGREVGVAAPGTHRRVDPGRCAGPCRVWTSAANSVSDFHLEMLATAADSPLRFRMIYRPDLWSVAAVERLGRQFAESLLRLVGPASPPYRPSR
jgi:hypothetical protein